VPNSMEMKNIVLREVHNVPYAGNPGYKKSITTISSQHFFLGMKKEVVDYVA
jgi:hypothetical protein